MDFLMIVNSIIGVIRGTPWWVWLIFAFLIYRGINALQPRVTSLRSIFLMPTIFFGFAVNSLLKNPCATPYVLSLWLLALLAGVGAAWLLNRRLVIKADKRKHLIQLPGTVSVLITVISIFAIKYFFGYMAAVHADMCSTPLFIYVKLMLYGGLSGLSVGKMLQYLHKYYRAENVELNL